MAAEGLLPLDVMLITMRDAWAANDRQLAIQAAKDAAPYIHARLISAESKSEVTHHYVAEVPAVAATDEEWKRRHTPVLQ